MNVSSWFGERTISDAEVRSEVWKLGGRHHGYPLEGALEELKAPGLGGRQANLLRACVRQLRGA